ncbi:MAG: hypothetical protein Tsb009_12330 [Planctomycetaceae bacterium]
MITRRSSRRRPSARQFSLLNFLKRGREKRLRRRQKIEVFEIAEFGTAAEQLEDRTLLTTTLFLDFGAGIGMGNTLSTTTDAFRDIYGVGNPGGGGSFGTGSNLIGNGLNSGDSLDFTPLAYDFNGDSTIDNADITALANAVLPLVQRAMEPFDIDVVIAGATSFADSVASVGANAGDASGEFDAYNFIMDITSDGFGGGSVGDNATGDGDHMDVRDGAGLFGIAAADDLFAQAGNDQDEATLTFSDTIFDSTSGTPGTAAFNANLAQRIAYTATHEAFHTFTLVHTTGLEAGGDVIRLGSNTREDPFMVTRFDLNRQNNFPVAEPNNYLQIAGDPDIGLRDTDNDTIPDLAYVTGTGAHDVITLTNNGGGMVGVQVQAFSNSNHTGLIGTETYTINLATDTEGTILIDAGTNNDIINIDGSIAAMIRVRGGEGVEGIAVGPENDLLVVTGGGGTGSYTPSGTDGGTISVAGGATIDASELEPVEISGFANFTFTTPNATDNLTVSAATAMGGQAALQITGTSGGVAFEVPTFYDVNSLTIEAGTNDGGGAVDTISLPAGFSPQGIGQLHINTGGGNDVVSVGAGTYGFTVDIDAGAGTESINISNINISNITGGAADGLRISNVETVSVSNSTFVGHSDDGVQIANASTSVSLTNITATGNTFGTFLTGTTGAATVTGGTYSSNTFDGFLV